MPDTALITRNFILYFLLPFWIGLGFVDYLCHRRTQIEATSGVRESLIHWAMLGFTGIPMTLGLLFTINPLVIVTMLVVFLVHEALATWDVNYAIGHGRRIVTLERRVHSYLEVMPFMIASMIICLHWDQFLVLIGFGSQPGTFVSLHFKEPPLPLNYVVAIFAGVFGFMAVPYAEELWRCFRTARTAGTAGLPRA